MDHRNTMKNRRGKNKGQLSETQKNVARMRQKTFPSLLCNILSKTINGETNCAVVMCISPSPYNGSETSFTVGECIMNLDY